MSKGVKKKGFTLVELVVVLAIFGLLASITGLGLYSWTRYSINKENNENARTIFLAAQESLTHMQASGTLDSIDLTYVEKTKVEQIKQQNVGMDFTNFDKFSGRLYTAIYMPTNKSGIVYDLLKPYLEGTGVLDGAIAIEFDPYDGVVYSVFYSKKATSFEYETDGNINESGVIGICKRDSGILKDRLLGYYAADLTAAKPVQTPVVYFESVEGSKDVQLINEEELYYRIPFSSLNITDSNKLFLSDSVYKIYINDKHSTSDLITLNFSGSSFDQVNNIVRISATYKTKQNGNQTTTEDIKLKYLVINSELRIFFDSIDVNTVKLLSTSNIQFQGSSTTFSNVGNHFTGTYGIFNLLREAEKNQNHAFEIDFLSIYCKSEITIAGDKRVFDSSETHNYLYDNMTIDGNTIKVEISNIRHLFNICYLEKINNSSNYIIKYTQTKDIEYDGKYVFSTVNNHVGLSDVDSFPTIPALGSNSTYDAKDYSGVVHSISNLKLDSLILTSYNSNSMYSKCLGIFAENYGTIKNLKLTDVELNSSLNQDGQYDVESTTYQYGSGAISGLNSGVIDNCEVSGEIIGNVNIGGIAGVNYSKIKDCVSKVLVKAHNSNSYNLGGIAGFSVQKKNTGGQQHQTVPTSIIENCTYIATNTITLDMLNQTSNPFADDLKGIHIGGIVGRIIDGAEVKNCHSETTEEGYLIGYGSVGGIVGRTDNDSKITSEINNGQRLTYNSINVIGVDCVGGVVANIDNSNTSPERSFSNLENRGAVVCINLNDGKKWAGGITAYLNEKTSINNCLSDVEKTDVKELLVYKYSNNDIVGGLVGDLRGKIVSSEIVEHKVLVGGGNNVGGLVGLSANNSDIINQKIVSGFVYGENNVGGIVGNNSIEFYGKGKDGNLFENNIDLVSGINNVGGLIGYSNGKLDGNAIYSHTIEKVDGQNNVGGLIGETSKLVYNQMANVKVFSTGNCVGGVVGKTTEKIDSAETIQHEVSVSGVNNVGGVAGESNSLIYNQYVKGSVSGDTFVGGIIGINVNKIDAKDKLLNEVTVTGINYIGGIAGKNEGEIYKIYSKATVKATGNYVGGIAGFNSNKIQLEKDMVNTVYVSGTSEVGGIVGFNETDGEIYSVSLSGTVVGTEDNIGGVIGINKARISDINNNVSLVKGKDNVGGYIGYGVQGSVAENISQLKDINISGRNYVGGIFGYDYLESWISNSISIENVVLEGNEYIGSFAGQIDSNYNLENIDLNIKNNNISGNKYIGGIAGKITSKGNDVSIKGNVNDTTITGSDYVAGVVPVLEEKVHIASNSNLSINHSEVKDINNDSSEDNKYFSLGVCINNSTIKNFYIDNSVLNTGDNSFVGGIADLNHGIISNSKFTQSVIKHGDKTSAGFIAGKNEGTIQNSNVYNNSYIANENTIISAVYLGDIVGINGSLSVLDTERMATISNCKSVNLISEGNQREIGIAGINLAKIENTSLFNDSHQNLVETAWNSNSKRDELTLREPVRNENGTLTISFSGYNSEDLNFKLIINVLDIKDGNIVSNNVYSAENTDVTCDLQNKTCSYNLSPDKVVGNNGFVVYVENLDDRTENSINNLSSISSRSYYYEIPLSTVDFGVTNENNLFKITYTPLSGDLVNYINKYQLKYQIDDSSVNIVDFENNYLELDDITGINVQLAVIAVPKSEYGFYAESETVWKTYSITNILSTENNITEANENIEVNENQNLGEENE